MKCAVYVRVSTEGQRDNYSTEVQKERGTQFALSNGWEPIFYEDVESGSTNKRKEFSKLILDIQNKEIGAVWVIEFTRLSRNDEEESIFIKRLFQEYSIRLFDNGTEITFDSPEDQLFYSFRSSIAAYERRKITERMRNGMIKKYSQGGRRYPHSFGYDYVGEDTFINETEASVVREIYDRVGKGEKFGLIANDLTMRGVKTKKGLTAWSTDKISKLVRYTIYIGLIKAPNGELIPSTHYEPIIDQATWDKVQSRIRLNQKYYEKVSVRKGLFELSGIVKCKNCGIQYYRKSNYRKVDGNKVERGFYIHVAKTKDARECQKTREYTSIDERKLCDLVRAIYLEIFEDYDSVRSFYEDEAKRIDKENDEIISNINDMKKHLKDLEKQKAKLIDLAIQGLFSVEEIKVKKDTLDHQIATISSKVNQLSITIQDAKSELELLDDFSEQEANEFLDLTEHARKGLYLKRINYLVIDHRSLEIEFINNNKYVIPDIYNLDPYWQGRVDLVRSYFEGRLID